MFSVPGQQTMTYRAFFHVSAAYRNSSNRRDFLLRLIILTSGLIHEGLGLLLQAGIPGDPHDKSDAILVAPMQDLPPAKNAVPRKMIWL